MLHLLTIPAGLAASVLFFAFCKIAGRAVLRGFDSPAEATDYEALTTVVLQFGVGFAAIGFAVLALGALGILTGVELVLAALLWIVAIAVWEPETRTALFWKAQWSELRRAIDRPAALILGLFAIAAIGNAMPETGFDVTEYHYAYALEWAQAGRIFADPFIPTEAYFANNLQALYAAAFALHLGAIVHFINWLCGLFASLAAYAIARAILEDSLADDALKERIACGCALAAGLVPVLSPWFLGYAGSGYIDIPIGFATALPILGIVAWLRTHDQRALASAAITGGYAVGLKLSLIGMLPLYLPLLVWAARALPHKRILGFVAALLVLSSPWYVRNLIAVGDPIPPAFNAILRGNDPIYSRGDILRMSADLHRVRDDGSLLSLPLRLVVHAPDRIYVESGIPLVVAATYLPLLFLVWIVGRRFFRREPSDDEKLILYGSTAYPIVLWLATATEARYLLETFPLLCASLAVGCAGALQRIAAWFPASMRTAAVVTAMVLGCISASLPYQGPTLYARIPAVRSIALALGGISPRLLLTNFTPGYQEVRYATDIARTADPPGTVLQLGFENLRMYSADQNVESVGGWVGPGRYFDVIDAAYRGVLPGYLNAHHVAAAVVDQTGRTIGSEDAAVVSNALLDAGFRDVTPSDDTVKVYARS